MRPPLPTLGPAPKKSPVGPALAVSLIVGLSAGGVWWWKQRAGSDKPESPAEPQAAAPAVPGSESAAAPVAAAPTASPPAAAVTPPPARTPPPAPGTPPPAAAPVAAAAHTVTATAAQTVQESAWQRASMRIDGPLEKAVVGAAGPEVGPALAQVVTRTLVWWVDVPGDIRRGDTLDVLYQVRPGEEPLVHAVRFTSGKTGQTHRTYRYQASGDRNPRYYLPNGEELELRLEGSPLDDYEQVTSLLRDGRKHKGVDFKTPVGSPVKAPFTGVVRRKNWSFRFNGNCIDLEEAGGKHRHALFLHMEELPRSLKVGDRFTAGTVMGRSGNSGHSFAPHLHYQLEAADERVLDPYESHRTYRRSLPAAQRAAFDAEVRRQEGLLGTGPAVAGTSP